MERRRQKVAAQQEAEPVARERVEAEELQRAIWSEIVRAQYRGMRSEMIVAVVRRLSDEIEENLSAEERFYQEYLRKS